MSALCQSAEYIYPTNLQEIGSPWAFVDNMTHPILNSGMTEEQKDNEKE